MEIKTGISNENIDILIEYSKTDADVAKFTSDQKRFANRDSFNEWLGKGRTIYSLVNEQGKLVGITWFGYANEGFTLAIRLYAEARGKGLAKSFLEETMEMFRKTKQYLEKENKSFWLEVSRDNLPAISTYTKLGFKPEKQGSTEDKVIYWKHYE